jgi:monoterpene epsilon-lactone hydrolase
MFSQEMEKWIQVNREAKRATKNVELTPELCLGARASFDQMLGSIPVPECIDVQPETINGVSGETYHYNGDRPAGLNDKIILFIHGGGFATGSVASRRYLCVTTLKYAKMDAFSMEYTQFPEGVFPEGLVDAMRAFRGLQEKGYRPENIYLYGESGGAMLCLALTLHLMDHKKALPGKVAVFSPVTNVITENESRVTREERDPIIQGYINDQLDGYFSEYEKQSKYVSSINADFEGFPKLLVNVGTEEVLWDDSFLLVEKAKAAGVDAELKPWEGLFHVFTMFPAPETEEALQFNAAFFSGEEN